VLFSLFLCEFQSRKKVYSVNKIPQAIFLQLLLTTEAMGIWRFAGASLSHSDKVNAGAKPPECTSASQ